VTAGDRAGEPQPQPTADPEPQPEPEVPPQVVAAPGRFAFGPAIARFDQRADIALERLRGNPLADAVFVSATRLGDWSLIWHIVNVSRGLTGSRRESEVPVLALALGAESLLVNQGLKRLFHRPRPTREGDPRYPVRRPLTSSFPSGHASAAAFTAVVLTGWDGRRSAPLWATLAGVVAVSRAYVRIHHASDVVAGAAMGVVAGRLVLRRWPLPAEQGRGRA
jgi:membrane-associated phospholipid phosphatase